MNSVTKILPQSTKTSSSKARETQDTVIDIAMNTDAAPIIAVESPMPLTCHLNQQPITKEALIDRKGRIYDAHGAIKPAIETVLDRRLSEIIQSHQKHIIEESNQGIPWSMPLQWSRDPITCLPLHSPVISDEGHTYNIQTLEKTEYISPYTRKRLNIFTRKLAVLQSLFSHYNFEIPNRAEEHEQRQDDTTNCSRLCLDGLSTCMKCICDCIINCCVTRRRHTLSQEYKFNKICVTAAGTISGIIFAYVASGDSCNTGDMGPCIMFFPFAAILGALSCNILACCGECCCINTEMWTD